jgi:hypothetical protein
MAAMAAMAATQSVGAREQREQRVGNEQVYRVLRREPLTTDEARLLSERRSCAHADARLMSPAQREMIADMRAYVVATGSFKHAKSLDARHVDEIRRQRLRRQQLDEQ